LTKEWGIKNRISPVMYVHEKSRPTSQLAGLIELFKLFSKESDEYIMISQVREELVDSLKYIKPYKGKWHKGIKKENDVIYYNEREWRYSPLIEEYEVLAGINENKKLKNKFNRKLRQSKIPFAPEDIKFIVIKSRDEITGITNLIRNLKIKPNQKNRLITKIITFEEIEEDYV
ncbi:MAG: abortive infection system antitoxin AbiGi family protein, partial [Bacteroidia bacterium]